MKKGIITKVLGYVIFLVAALLVIGMFFSTSRRGRTGEFYQNEVYPHYLTYDQNSNYFDGYVTASNAFYDRDPIFTYSNFDNEESELHFSLNIYRMRQTVTQDKLYFFEQKRVVNGYIVEIKDLSYKNVDLMELTRGVNEDPSFEHYLRVTLGFSPAVLPNVQQNDNAYSYTLVPAYPAMISDLILDLNEKGVESYAVLEKIQIWHYPLDEEKQPIDDQKQLLYMFSADDVMDEGDEVTVNVKGLSLERDDYLITNDEVAGAFPTDLEMSNANFYYEKLDLSAYNGRVVRTVLIVSAIAVVAAYFMFAHKLVMNKIHETRTQKKLNAKKTESMLEGDIVDAEYDSIHEVDEGDAGGISIDVDIEEPSDFEE